MQDITSNNNNNNSNSNSNSTSSASNSTVNHNRGSVLMSILTSPAINRTNASSVAATQQILDAISTPKSSTNNTEQQMNGHVTHDNASGKNNLSKKSNSSPVIARKSRAKKSLPVDDDKDLIDNRTSTPVLGQNNNNVILNTELL